jgi:PAS domain S-box-containing protein
MAFLFSIGVAFLDGIIDYFFFMEEESILDALFFDVSVFEIYIRSMIVITFTIFGALTALFINRIKRDKELLAESELKFKTVATYSNDWIYWIAPDKSYYFISPSCETITGYSISDFEKNINFLDDIIHPDDREMFVNHESNSLKGESLEEFQFRIITKAKETKWIHHLCQPVYKDNIYLGHRVSNRDLTKLKNAEDELTRIGERLKEANRTLRDLVEQRTIEMTTFMTQCPYPRAVYDKNGDLINCNPAWQSEFPTNADKNNLYNHYLVKNSRLEDRIKHVFNIGEGFKSHPIYYEEIDKMLVLDFYAIKNSKYEIEKVVLNVEDITEHTRHKELSKELETRKDLIGEIFDYLEADRRHISKDLHDRIGQNLMLIKMNAELIKDANLYAPEKSDEIVDLTIRTSKEIREIIYSLYPVEIEKYGLLESIRNMVNRIDELTEMKFEIKFAGDYKPMSKRFELAIFRVIQEALNNIAKHSKANSVKLNINFKSNIILGMISDDGVGINKLSRDESKYGMKFMEERIESLGGYFELNSENKKGTSIHFEIPITN